MTSTPPLEVLPGTNPIRSAQRVLLVDDNPYIHPLLGEMLRSEGCEVISSRNPLSAVNVFLECRPEMVFIDYCMPEMNGFELSQALHTLDADCPIVMVTGLDEPALRSRAKALGIHWVVGKPFRVEEIFEALHAVRTWLRAPSILEAAL